MANIKDGQTWPLTHVQGLSGSPRWSHDGKWIVFDSRTKRASKLFKAPSTGGEPVRLTAGDATDQLPVWSADDNLIYFSSNRSGEYQIWAVSANGGAASAVTESAGTAPETSPDGQSLYYLEEQFEPSTLWRKDLSNGTSSVIAHDVCFRSVALGKKAVYYLTQSDLILHALDQKSGHVMTLGTLSRNTVGGMSLSPDERYLYFAELDHFGDELMLVNDFQ